MQEYLCDHEVVTRLLSNVLEDEKAQQIMDTLLCDFGSLERILCATPEQLALSIKDTAQIKNKIVFLLACAKALTKRRYTDGFIIGKQYSEDAIVKYLIGLFLFDNVESIYMLSFDRDGTFLGTDSLGAGTVNNSNVTMRRALELALRRGASYVIFAHNHPMGHTTPSGEDMSTTYQLSRAFATVNIEMREHYIISGNEYRRINADLAAVANAQTSPLYR